MAQLAEQLICNQQVGGSSPPDSSKFLEGGQNMRRKYHCVLLLIVGIMLLFSTTTLAAENNSTFATGKAFNEKCIELANGAENIETIVKSDVPINKDNVISEQNSPEIYIGYEASTKTIWVYSEKQMFLNEDSSDIFKGFTNLKKIDNFNVDSKNVKNISHFFEGCKSLESIDLTSWNLSNIKEMEGTFSGCENLKEIKFPTPIDEETAKKINEENAKKAQEEHKEKPADIAVNLLKPENITAGFFNCKNIEVIDLSIMRSDNLKKVDNTFNGCEKLKAVKTDKSLVFPAGEGVFVNTKELTGSNGTKWNTEHTNNEYARLDNYKNQGYFSNDKNATVKVEGDNIETTSFVRDDSKNAWKDDYFKGTIKVKNGFEVESIVAESNGQNFTGFKQFEENGAVKIEVDKVPQEGVLFKISTIVKPNDDEKPKEKTTENNNEKQNSNKIDVDPIDLNLDDINLKTQATPSISYSAHVQNVGWQSSVSNGSTAGTTGKAYRLEAFTASLSNVPSSYGTSGVSYSSSGSATSNSSSNGGTCGVTGKDNKITSFSMSLTGGIASHYAIYYRGYFENTEWASWKSSGSTSSGSNRLEAMQAKLVAKPGCTYTIKVVKPNGTTSTSTQTIGVDDIGVSKSFSGSSGTGYSAYSYNLTWTGSSVTVGSTSGCTVSKSVTSSGSYNENGTTNGAATITVTPTPKYTTSLSGSYVSSTSGFGTDMATNGSSWTGKFKTSGSYYYLSSSITVKVNGTTLSSSYYTYSGSGTTSGTITVQASKVTGPITVTASAYYSPPTSYYNVSFSGTGLTCSNTGSSKFSSSSGWSGYLSANSGYGLPSSISMTRGGSSFSNYSYNASTGYISVSSSYASGNLVISATGVSLVAAEFTGVGLTASSGFTSQAINPSNSNVGWTGTFTAQTGYSLPTSVNVTVDGNLLSSSYYSYSRSGSTGTVSVSGSYATGKITVSANGIPATYTATLSGSNVSAASTDNTVKRISRTKTTSVDGTTSSGNYGNFAYLIDPVTISGAPSLDVNVTYATESTNYDWVCVYDSSTTPTASNYDSSISGKLGGTTKQTSNYTVSGNTVNMFFRSDTSSDAYYGYYAQISGHVDTSQFGSSKVLYNQPWCGKIQAASGYELPSSITVSCGGSTLSTSAYSYDSTTGQIEVYPQYVTGAITVSATAVEAPTYYSGTLNGTHVSATSGFGSTIRENTTWTAYIQADTGYSLPNSITMTRGGSSFTNFTYTQSTGKIEVSSSYVTGNFVVTADGVVNQYATTLITPGGVSTVSGFSSTGATYGQDWSGQIQANTGYKLPTEISVSINNTASNNYSYDSSTGMITVSSSYVTGPIEITANGIIPGATFITGSDFNTKAISLAGNANNIIHIKRSTTCDDAYKVTANCVSINYSEYPIYMWFDSSTGTLNYWSEVDPYTNENAAQMFRTIKRESSVIQLPR